MARPTLLLVHEPEAACFSRLVAAGRTPTHAAEIASYLAQSTDIAREFAEIGMACAAEGLDFRPVELDEAPATLASASREASLVWTLTDGITFFRGGVAPALARLHGLATIGADDSLFALCQDKFRAGAVMRAIGLPVPEAGLARDDTWLVAPPASPEGWFVKPNRLGSKIGIWDDSHAATPARALDLSRRIFAAYGDEAIVQRYVRGRNARASFLAVEPDAGPERLGVFEVEAGGDFQTMADSLALYGATGAAAMEAGRQVEPALVQLGRRQPGADAAIREIAGHLMRVLGLRDVYSLDLRVEDDDTVHLRIRGLPRPAMLRLPGLLPGRMGSVAGTGDGQDGGRTTRPLKITCEDQLASMQIGVWPALRKPSFDAAAFDTSITRPRMKGPRSLMRTTTDLPLRWLVTTTLEPKGSVRCAAVMAAGFIRSPDAVFEVSAYHDALPHWAEEGVEQATTVVAAKAVNAAVRSCGFMCRKRPLLMTISRR